MRALLLATELSSYQYAIASIAALAFFLTVRQSREWLQAWKLRGANRGDRLRICHPSAELVPPEDAWEKEWRFAEACAEQVRRAA